MDKDVHREECLSECTNNNEISFVHIESKSIVCHPARNITEGGTLLCKNNLCLLSFVVTNMYIWMSSAYFIQMMV